MHRAAALALVLVALSAGAEMYKIVGADGRVSYSDRPPVDAKAAQSVSEFKVHSYSGPPVVGTATNWQAILRRPIAGLPAASRGGVVLYSTESCGFCKKAKKYMDAKGVGYTEIDIGKDPRGHEEYKQLGGRGVPFFVNGGRTLTGFDEASFEQFLKGGA